jgi:hypothetical protein
MRQGSSKVFTVVMVKGILASGFCSPALTCAQAATAASVRINAAFSNFIIIIISVFAFQTPALKRARGQFSIDSSIEIVLKKSMAAISWKPSERNAITELRQRKSLSGDSGDPERELIARVRNPATLVTPALSI